VRDARQRRQPPAPEVVAQEIVEHLQAALDEFAVVAEAMQLAKAERDQCVTDQ
jgi:hypothetical protein